MEQIYTSEKEYFDSIIKEALASGLIRNGIDGRTPTEEELLALIKPLIPEIKLPTDEKLLTLIRPLIPKVVIPSTTEVALEASRIALDELKPLIPVIIPETAIQVRDKLETLIEDERLDAKAIKGLDFINQQTLDRAVGILDSRTSFLINKINNLPPNGGGAVSSVSNSDGTLTISPTTGAVVSSLNLNHANTWLTTQTFATTIGFTANNAVISLPSNLQIISAFNVGGIFRVGNSDGALKVDMELWTMKFQNTSGFRVLDLDAGTYRAIIGDFDGQNSGNYIDTDDSSAITIFGVGGLINFPGQDMYFESFFGGSWINMSTNGPSGLGSGGAGATAWIAYANSAGNWFPNATAGDVVYRSTSNTTRLLFGNDGLVNAPMVLYGNNLSLNGANATANLHLAASTTSRASFRIPLGTDPSSPNEGDMWGSSTQKALKMFNDGVTQVASSVLFTQTADATVTNTVTETSILGTGVGTKTLPANFFVAGKTIRILVSGIYSTPALGATATVKIKYGSTVLATVATSSLLGGASGLEFRGEAVITCRTTGSSGTVMTGGRVIYASGVAGQVAQDSLNNGGATTTINTTTSNALDVTVTWDSNTTTRIATSTVSTIEVLN